jgi:hypothetical protein
MGNYNFKKDLSISEAEVPEVLEKIKQTFVGIKDLHHPEGYLKEYDIIGTFKDIPVTFEVKNDKMSLDTGNFGIEYESWGKPSGITTTTAKYWIHKMYGDYYITPVKVVKDMIAQKQYFRTVIGGDKGSNTKMYLFKKTLLNRWQKM